MPVFPFLPGIDIFDGQKKTIILVRVFKIILLLSLVACNVVLGQGLTPSDSLPAYFSLKLSEVNEKVVLTGYNANYGPLTGYMKDNQADSVIFEWVIPARGKRNLMSLRGEKSAVRDSLLNSYSFGYHLGDVYSVRPDTSFIYRLPVQKKKRYRISQGFYGKRSHDHPLSYHAIDIEMNVGEPVYAARGGLVVTSIDWFTKSGGPELKDYGNRILILHEDGTIAFYVHLSHRGVLVEEGDRVKKGQLIGFSGNTGYSNGPHLHFVVRKERDISIPVRFEGYEEKSMTSGLRIKVKK